jgi:CheY-like chemotaxis protein
VALGLEHAHVRGMIHRDIKPHNLMLAAGETIKILDFGLARLMEEALEPTIAQAASPGLQYSDLFQTCADMRMGTADYLAPEAIADPHAADIRSDIYSLGCTLYRLLSGKYPCPAPSLQEKLDCHRRGVLLPLSDVCDVPREVVRVIERMLARWPADRYQTPGEAADALAAAMAQRPRVLVVDDEPGLREIANRILTAQGYEVSCAANGNEALARLHSGLRPDLILLDLMMPVMDGWEFLRRQKQDESLASIPVVVISSNDAVALRAAAAGAINCLKKPLHFRELSATLERLQA